MTGCQRKKRFPCTRGGKEGGGAAGSANHPSAVSQLHFFAWGSVAGKVSLAAPRAGDPPGRNASRFTFQVLRFTHHCLFLYTSHRFGCEICQSLLRLLRLCYAFCYGSKVSKPLIPLVCYDCYGYLPQGDPPHRLEAAFRGFLWSLGPLVRRLRSASMVSGQWSRGPRRQALRFQLSAFRSIPPVSGRVPLHSGLFRPFPA